MIHASCGGVTHWALTPDDDDSVMTIGWGQNAANGNRSSIPNTSNAQGQPGHDQQVNSDWAQKNLGAPPNLLAISR